MSLISQLVVFSLDGFRYGLPLENVERVVRAVEVTSVPDVPEMVLGAVDVAGRIRPVVSLRRWFARTDREVRCTDLFVLAHSSRRDMALVVDEVQGVIDCPPELLMGADEMITGQGAVQGFIQMEDGLVVICDLERCLTPIQEEVLDRSAAGGSRHVA